MSDIPKTYFEDMELNGVLVTPGMTVTQAHVGLYTGLTSDTVEGAGAVPDLLPLCLTTGLGWRVAKPQLAVLAFMGFEWQMLAPLRVGDTIHSTARTAAKRSMREGGVLIEEREVINQRGEVVQRGRFTFLVAKRPVQKEASA
jgi:3-hydroxybutyryl-CoA dehydratase